ncbi:MAG: glycosyltransferase family 4 protein [Candidatus Levybacteria bacterium]|nr:glycosyltransferase family 4 protein [Candidatus Levybacteria bacterium]
MKIAVYHELPLGGARRAINEFSKVLKTKHKVDLYVLDEVRHPEEVFYSKTFSFIFKSKAWRGGDPLVKLYKDFVEVMLLYFFTKKIAAVINIRKYDIVIVSASRYIETPFITRFIRSPLVFYCSDPNYRFVYDNLVFLDKKIGNIRYYYEIFKRVIYKKLDRDNVQKAMLCLAPSHFIASKFSKTYNVPNTPVHYGVDTSFFTPGKIRKDIDILYIGSKAKVDGIDLLEKVIRFLPRKTVVKKILIEEEWISDDLILREYYRRSKIVFCPARKEGLGAVPMEAMSCGCVVVAVDEAGHKETIVNGVTGYLVPRNPKIIAERMRLQLVNPQIRRKVGKKGREIMEKMWSWEKRGEVFEKTIVQFVNDTKL